MDLGQASQLDREVLVALIVLEFLAIAIALRLAHQLSNEVLRPVGVLRDSANRLAMADAIAGSQRTLTEEANTDSLRATEALTTLCAAGMRIALDDFGTGYSSVGYLRQLPVDFLKIDRSFVAGAAPDSRNPLLEAIIGLAHHLDPEIIPEGIEQPSELAQLRALGCHLGQGFLMSRPVAPEAIENLLAAPIPFPHVEFDCAIYSSAM